MTVVTEPVTLDQAKDQCGILSAETDFDTKLGLLIKTARSHVERRTGMRFAEWNAVVPCGGFSDLSRLPEAPLKAVTSIGYVDETGSSQTLAASVYDVLKDPHHPAVILKIGQSWPVIQAGSVVTLTAAFGGSVPEEVQHAMLLFIADAFAQREDAKAEDWTVVDRVISDYRRSIV